MNDAPIGDDLLADVLPHAGFLLDTLLQGIREDDCAACEGSLYTFLRMAWPSFDSARFVGGWHLEAISEHLEAVSRGQITKLLINVRPRSCKTNLVAIAWPVWTWALPPDERYPLMGPQVQWLCGSYGANKARVDAVTARRLIGSSWFQERWGERVQIREDRDNQQQYDTVAGGVRISTGMPESIGRGGQIRLLDDPNKPDEVESELVNETNRRAYSEVWATRGNDPNSGAEVMIMQRQGERDLSGFWIERYGRDLVHLVIPAWYEPERKCTTYVNGVAFWTDPRTRDGESFWPERYGPDTREVDEALGPYAFAGQIQQAPEPRGGGIIKRAWWKEWPPADEEDAWIRDVEVEPGKLVPRLTFPKFSYVLTIVDGAYTTKEENDWSACITLGVFEDRRKYPKVMLVEAWRTRAEINGLKNKVWDTCERQGTDMLLIEAKGPGLSVAQEVRRLMREGAWSIMLDEPKGDKGARLLATQSMFLDGMIYAPKRNWARMVIDEVAAFPRVPHDDLTDCLSAGLLRLRKMDLARMVREVAKEQDEALLFVGKRPSVAEAYGVA